MINSGLEQLKSDFSRSDYTKIIPFEKISEQIEIFRKGIPFLRLKEPCTPGNGIVRIPEIKLTELTMKWKTAVDAGRVMKFVPASGAASRMFKELQSLSGKFKTINRHLLEKLINNGNSDAESVNKFITNIKNFAFYADLKLSLGKDGLDIEKLLSAGEYTEIIKYTIGKEGLNYSDKPKGSIKFHYYPTGSRTAFEEHLVEAINYASDKNGKSKVHFTISSEHSELARKIINNAVEKHKANGYTIDVTHSYQKPSTDTIAVTIDNKPFKDKKGELVFRPAGHGALLENLNDLKADIIFIKNIDNIVPDHLREETYKYKKIICGYLVELQTKIFSYLDLLTKDEIDNALIEEIKNFAENILFIRFKDDFTKAEKNEKVKTLFDKLNRPIRVCGMVKNEGHAGGGPFWVEEKDGSVSLQIVEKTQIDLNDESQSKILESSTHFNPVDLVCAVKDYRGKPFNLLKFTNPDSGLITIKSKDGKELKALELPGLWNGSMAKWITVFVEVPKITFNPVKEVNDLLLKEHQPED